MDTDTPKTPVAKSPWELVEYVTMNCNLTTVQKSALLGETERGYRSSGGWRESKMTIINRMLSYLEQILHYSTYDMSSYREAVKKFNITRSELQREELRDSILQLPTTRTRIHAVIKDENYFGNIADKDPGAGFVRYGERAIIKHLEEEICTGKLVDLLSFEEIQEIAINIERERVDPCDLYPNQIILKRFLISGVILDELLELLIATAELIQPIDRQFELNEYSSTLSVSYDVKRTKEELRKVLTETFLPKQQHLPEKISSDETDSLAYSDRAEKERVLNIRKKKLLKLKSQEGLYKCLRTREAHRQTRIRRPCGGQYNYDGEVVGNARGTIFKGFNHDEETALFAWGKLVELIEEAALLTSEGFNKENDRRIAKKLLEMIIFMNLHEYGNISEKAQTFAKEKGLGITRDDLQ
jgi:hypothetical protein